MDKLTRYSIDIARDPASALKKISDPILNPFAIFFASNVLTLIGGYESRFSPYFMALTIGKVSLPLALVLIADIFKRKQSSTLSLFFEEFSFIVPALRADEPAFSTWYSLDKSSFIAATIRVDEFAPAMWQAITPLAIGIINHSNIIDGIS